MRRGGGARAPGLLQGRVQSTSSESRKSLERRKSLARRNHAPPAPQSGTYETPAPGVASASAAAASAPLGVSTSSVLSGARPSRRKPACADRCAANSTPAASAPKQRKATKPCIVAGSAIGAAITFALPLSIAAPTV
eukprot:6690387-Prymnesium_polylepis.1